MKTSNFVKFLAVAVMGTGLMYGQASRTWVSGVGDDANPCSRTAPCKTFAGAISKTAPGGEIDALDPAGYGALTITKAITIDGGGGQVASVLVAGTNGIVVQAGGNDVVILRNLRLNGISGSGNGGLNGIRFLSGKDLNVENCFIFGFTQNGIDIALNQGTQPTVHVVNTVIKNIGGAGIRAQQAITPQVKVTIDNSQIMLANIGVEANQHSRVAVSRSLAAGNTSDGFRGDDSLSTDAQLTIDNSASENNGGSGITAQTGAQVTVGGSKVAFNGGRGLNQSRGRRLFTFTHGGNGTNRANGTIRGQTC